MMPHSARLCRAAGAVRQTCSLWRYACSKEPGACIGIMTSQVVPKQGSPACRLAVLAHMPHEDANSMSRLMCTTCSAIIIIMTMPHIAQTYRPTRVRSG